MTVKQNQEHVPTVPMMGVPPQPGLLPGQQNPAQTMSVPGQNLQNGAPMTDNFSPQRTH
jgi:hypothetical protein